MLQKNNFKIFMVIFSVFVVFVLHYNFYNVFYIDFCLIKVFVLEVLKSNIFANIIILFVLGSIIGWSFIFSVIKQPSNLKQKLAEEYIILLVSVLNHESVSDSFLFFTVFLGLFLGRRFVLFMSIPYPGLVLVIFFFPIFFFLLSFFFVYGYFLLSLKYPDSFGKILINFLENNARKEIFKLIDLREKKSGKKKNQELKK